MKYIKLRERVQKGDDAIWTDVSAKNMEKFVKISGVDHGRVYCVFEGKEYADYISMFQKIEIKG